MDIVLFCAQTFAYCKKALKRMTRNRMQMFFVFLFPVLMLLMMGFVFGGEDGSFGGFTVAVVNQDQQPTNVNGTIITNASLSSILVEVLNDANITTIEVTQVGSADSNGTAMYLLARSEVDAYIVIPENFTECLTLRYIYRFPNGTIVPIPIAPTVSIVTSSSDPLGSQIVSNTLVGIIDGFSKEYLNYILKNRGETDPVTRAYLDFLSEPITTKTTELDVSSIQVTWISYMVPGTLGIVILWAGFSNAARGIAHERNDGTLRRLIVASASPAALFLGEYLYNLILVFASSAFALITGVVVFNVTLNWDIVALIILTLLVSMSAIAPGFIVSGIAKNAETAGSIQTVLAIPLQFFTGSFFPLFLLPEAGQAFAMALPYTQYSLAVTDIMVNGLALADVLPNIIYISITGIILMILGILAYAKSLQKL